jgi:hypothetical protein
MMLAPGRPVVDPWRVRARPGGSTGRGGAGVERAASSAALHGSEHLQRDDHDDEPNTNRKGPADQVPDHKPHGGDDPISHARCNLATVGRWRGLWNVDGVCAWPGRRWRDKRRRVRTRLAFVLDWAHHPSGLCYGALYFTLRLAPQSQQVRASRVPVGYSNPVLAFRSHMRSLPSCVVTTTSKRHGTGKRQRTVGFAADARARCVGRGSFVARPSAWRRLVRGAGLALILGHRRAL